MASVGSRVFVLGGESSTPGKTDDPSVIHVLDTSARFFFSFSHLLQTILMIFDCFPCLLEHIKYPDAKSPPPKEVANTQAVRRPTNNNPASQGGPQLSHQISLSQVPSQQGGPSAIINGSRAMSPTGYPHHPASFDEGRGSIDDGGRKAISPVNMQQQPSMNGAANNFVFGARPGSAAAQVRARSRAGEGDDHNLADESFEGPVSQSLEPSPDAVRAKSPVSGGVDSMSMGATSTRAMSPYGDTYSSATPSGSMPANMASITMSRSGHAHGSSLSARSPSPVVDRSNPPADGFYPTGSGRVSPVVNGYGHGHSNHGHGRPGSIGNVSAELVRELRDAERDSWWKESREYDTSGSPKGFQRGTQTLDYHAADDFRADEEPTAADVTGTAHGEDIEETITQVYEALDGQYSAGRDEVLFTEISSTGGSRVETFLALLFLANRGQIRLEQDDLFGDLWIQNPATSAEGTEAIAD